MTSPKTVLRDEDTTSSDDLYLSFELGDQRWTLTLSDGRLLARNLCDMFFNPLIC